MPATPFFALAAGEASGDVLAAQLLAALAARWPAMRAAGIGGAHMAAQGFEVWEPVEKLSVRGYWEVLPRLPALLRLRRNVGGRLLAEKPDLFIGVDAPDFNFALEERLRSAGIATLHFVSPSFWAWRPEKLLRLRRAADHVLCLFPFEPDLLRAAGIAATYIGHPLAGVIPMEPNRAAARAALGLPQQGRVLALLPGSRTAEVQHLGRRFFQAAQQVLQSGAITQLVLPAVPHLFDRVQALAGEMLTAAEKERLLLLRGRAQDALAACDVTLIASGTATLEAALMKRPMVIAYAMPAASYWLMRRRRQLPWVGLPNILCAPLRWLQRPANVPAHQWADAPDAPFAVPELLQHAATPAALAAAVQHWLAHPDEVAALQQRFTALHHELRRDSAFLAADVIQSLLAHT